MTTLRPLFKQIPIYKDAIVEKNVRNDLRTIQINQLNALSELHSMTLTGRHQIPYLIRFLLITGKFI